MALGPGTRLGQFEISALIGAGGMGEVYRAVDTNLKRAVAIKVLPAALSNDPDRLARFRREAEVLAALNHPHIAAIYGLQNGDSPGTPTALVMELVEGRTLAELTAERAARAPGGLPVGEALPIARQIAQAVEAAHEQGIVHRDLKPANIKVRPDGTVKVLDFGLAKALEPPVAASAATSLSPTITSPAMTQVGVMVGTVAYASPEQARGAQADRRADVWAFGCVLFELLTGRPVFEGTTASDVFAAVLRADPDWRRLPPLHPRLRLMLERCLTRNASNRYQGIADARVDIEAAMNDPAGAFVAGDGRRHGRSRLGGWIALAGAVAAGALVTAAAMWRHAAPPNPSDERAVKFGLTPPDGMLFDVGWTVPFAVSPDGRMVAFTARSSDGKVLLWIRPLDGDGARPLQGTDGAQSPFWSPDSEWVAYYAGGSLKRVRATGGDPVTIVQTRSRGEAGSAWSRNGTILFKTGRFEAGWMGVSWQGGSPFEVTRLGTDETAHVWATFLPDGRHFVHRVWGRQPASSGIVLASLDGDPPRRLLGDPEGDRGLAFVPGFLLFLRKGALMARRFDEERMQLLDQEVRLVDDIPACCGSWDPWSASGGVIAYWRSYSGLNSVLRWHSRRDGPASESIGAPSHYSGLALSPLDDHLAFARYVGGARDIWVRDFSSGAETRLTWDGDSFDPVWSLDGTNVAFGSSRGNTPDVHVASASGGTSDTARRVTALTNAVDSPGSWTRDGRTLVYVSQNPDGQSDIRRVDLASGQEETLAVSGPFNDWDPRLSPDNRWMAYVTDASGIPEVWLAAYPSGDHRVRVSIHGGSQPQWRSDGRELYYVSSTLDLMVVPMQLSASVATAGKAQTLFRTQGLLPAIDGTVYAPSRDGQRFLMNVVAPGATQPPLQVIVNWQTLLADR